MSELRQSAQPMVITDIHMPFWSMVVFLVNLAIAAIPAILILSILGAILGAIFSAIFAGFHGH